MSTDLTMRMSERFLAARMPHALAAVIALLESVSRASMQNVGPGAA